MEQGTLGELYLTRSVTKHIRKHNKNLVSGGATLNDCALFSVADEDLAMSEGWGTTPYIAWVKAMNNLITSGANPVGVRLLMMLPEDILESDIKEYMFRFNKLADDSSIQIMGGHTQVSVAYVTPTFVVTVIGRNGNFSPNFKAIKSGDQIIMTKWTGLLGTDVIAREKREILLEKLSSSYIDGGIFGEELYQVLEEGKLLASLEDKVLYMHDISVGGVYSGLWQLGARINKGIKINHYDIPIKQETIEFCEIFDINPYMLEGTGSLLVVAKKGEDVVQSLLDNNIPAAVIGEVTDSKEKVVVLGDDGEKRFLAPAKGDEIYKVVSLY